MRGLASAVLGRLRGIAPNHLRCALGAHKYLITQRNIQSRVGLSEAPIGTASQCSEQAADQVFAVQIDVLVSADETCLELRNGLICGLCFRLRFTQSQEGARGLFDPRGLVSLTQPLTPLSHRGFCDLDLFEAL